MENKQLELWKNLNKNNTLVEIQKYIKNVMKIRGFLEEPIELKMLMLTEEIGEVAKAIRKDKVNMGIDKNNINNYGTIESELADVFIVLISICNVLNIDLFTAIKNKEEKNINRTWQVNKLEEDITI